MAIVYGHEIYYQKLIEDEQFLHEVALQDFDIDTTRLSEIIYLSILHQKHFVCNDHFSYILISPYQTLQDLIVSGSFFQCNIFVSIDFIFAKYFHFYSRSSFIDTSNCTGMTT
jgi:hypothetical protein